MTNEEIGSLIFNTATYNGMPPALADLIEAQSKHETANYSSNAFLKNNNCFGYKFVSGSHYQVGAGIKSTEKDPYAAYATIEDSVDELCAWVNRRQIQGKFPKDLSTIQTPIEYATLLKNCGYFGDPLQNYVSGLTHYQSDNNA